MSSAANHKRGPLEEEFQRRMHDAEASPSPDLWARIDHDLTLQESNHYKKRMVLYRQLAAACFVLFVLAGALLTFHFKEGAITPAITASVQPKSENNSVKEIAKAQELTQQEVQPEKSAVAQSEVKRSNRGADLTKNEISVPMIPLIREQSTEAGAAEKNPEENLTSIGTLAGIESSFKEIDFSYPGEAKGENKATERKSRFDSVRPFYQTARQAIAAVPLPSNNSFSNASGDQNEKGQPRSLVELSRVLQENIAATKQKADELSFALNSGTTSEKKDESKNNSDNSWTLGMGYAPSFFNQNIGMPQNMMLAISDRSLVAPGPDVTRVSSSNLYYAQDEFERNTDPAFSYAVEIKTGYKLGKKLKVISGLGFTQNTARTKSNYILQQFLYKPNTNKRVPLPATTVFLPSLNNNFTTDSLAVYRADEFYVNYRYRHITLPVGLQYEGNINKNWFWYGAGGVAANFLVETTVMATNNEVQDVDYGFNDDSPFRKVQFSGNVSLGVGKRVAQAISVTAGPEFRGYLNSLLAEPGKALAPQGRPYTVGINMSVNYDLGRR